MNWTIEQIEQSVFNFALFNRQAQEKIVEYLRCNVPFEMFREQKSRKEKAVKNMRNAKNILLGTQQEYPQHLNFSNVSYCRQDIKNYAVLIMAGGEGERLRVSLKEKGYSDEDLADFTKATFPIPNTNYKFGALEVNLRMIADLCKKTNFEIPVIITTGPKDSGTWKIIPKILQENANFGIKNIEIIAQNERLHLTNDDKIVFETDGENVKPLTNPDETGGPIFKLKESNVLESLEKNGIKKVIVLQGTAIYSNEILSIIATAGLNYDSLGIGILRNDFSENDPYGTFVSVKNGESFNLRIIEKDTRTTDTYKIQNQDKKFLPYNTGFYVFDIELLKKIEMPDYATPPKIILSGIEKSPKIGYAATDIIAFAKNPAVLTISENDFHVIKNAEDIYILAEIIKKFAL